MKTLFFLLALVLSVNAFAQEKSKSKTPFLRVFNVEGKKIGKGRLVKATDSMLVLKRNKKTIEILVSTIGLIKTKRSFGNNVLTGAAVGVGTIGLIGVSGSSSSGFVSFSGTEGFAAGTLVGAPIGSVVGAVTGIFKNSKTYEINGSQEQWTTFKALFTDE
jgi:hypothetical protein